MKVKKIFLAAFAAVFAAIALICLFAYIGSVKKSENLMDINLYFFNPSDNTITAEKRSIPKTEDHNVLISSVEKAYREGPRNPSLTRAMPSSVDFEITNNEKGIGNVIDIDLKGDFEGAGSSAKLACIGSVVYTFSDISFIDNVRLSVNGENIADAYNMYGKNTASLNRENVVSNPVINPEKIDKEKVVLYFLNAEGTALLPQECSIEVKQSRSLEYQIVEQLITGPSDDEMRAVLPADTKIKDIKTEEGICYVNFSGDFVSKLSGSAAQEKLTIYSIVNSLTELNTVNKVQFLVDGERMSEKKGHYDFGKTFERDETLISK